MATSGTNIITQRVRLLLNDTSTQSNVQRWVDATLLRFLNDAVTLICELRPDAKIADDGTIRTITALADIGSSISIADKWMLAICHYICARALEMQGGERMNLDASNHHQKAFMDLVKSM